MYASTSVVIGPKATTHIGRDDTRALHINSEDGAFLSILGNDEGPEFWDHLAADATKIAEAIRAAELLESAVS